MNPITDQPPPPQQQPAQPPRSSFSCDRHPTEAFTGFCPSCLCERLTTLDQSATSAAGGPSSSSRRNSTSSAIKALFKPVMMTSSSSSSLVPELRRTKSFSASKYDACAGVAASYEPQRHSCDVRGGGRHTLWSLFSIHDDDVIKEVDEFQSRAPELRDAELEESIVVEVEEREIIKKNDDVIIEEEMQAYDVIEEEEVQARVPVINNNRYADLNDVIEEKSDVINDINKPMKDLLEECSNSNNHKKKMTSSRSNFWSAASVLSKKWAKWRRKQKKGEGEVMTSAKLPVEKPIGRQYRETQSEIADYGFGRRSCDTDPRFSLDAGRVSFDDPRYSFDEPRASWDGYLIGRTFPRLPVMVEDAPVVPVVPIVPRCDMQIPVEEARVGPDVDGDVPGGSIQTREYYLDSSSSKRRKSLDRSNSIRKMAAAVVAELDESKAKPTASSVSNSKVSPTNEPPRVSNSNSLRDECGSETFELGFRDNGIGVEKKEMKKPRRWKWKLWGLIHRRGKDDDEDRCSSVSGVGRSYSESWQDGTNGIHNGMNRNVFRSNSSVSMRSSSLRKTNGHSHGHSHGKVIGNEQVYERNRSARYSPNHIDNGLLRFYLPPLSGSRRGGIGISTGKSRGSGNNSHSIARSMLRLY